MLEKIKEKLGDLSADYGEIHYEELSSTRVIYTNDAAELVTVSTTAGGNARVLVNDGWGFASFNEPDFERQLQNACENARLSGRGVSKIRRFSKPVVDEVRSVYRRSPDSMSLEEKCALVAGYSALLRHPLLSSTKVIYQDYTVTKYFANTEGSLIKQTKTFTGMMASAMSRDGNNIQNAFESEGTYGGLELVLGREAQVESVKQRAIDLLKAPKVEAGTYKVLLDPKLAGVFAHEAFGHLSEADFLYENPRMQDVMTLGKGFGPEELNIIDDGSQIDLAGYTPYDDEGIPARKNYLIRGGKLSGRLHSRETAEKMGEPETGNARAVKAYYQPIVRMTSTYIDAGKSTFEEMIGSIDDGIYALDMLGGMTNLEMFTFSAGYAYRIKNGKIGELLKDVVLSGNVFSTLHNIKTVGNDLKHHGGLGGCGKGGQGGLPVSTGSPHLVIADVLIGGV